MDKVMDRVRKLDAYPKINEDFYKRTVSGGLITLVSSTFMLLLFLSEFSKYLSLDPLPFLLILHDLAGVLGLLTIIFLTT